MVFNAGLTVSNEPNVGRKAATHGQDRRPHSLHLPLAEKLSHIDHALKWHAEWPRRVWRSENPFARTIDAYERALASQSVDRFMRLDYRIRPGIRVEEAVDWQSPRRDGAGRLAFRSAVVCNGQSMPGTSKEIAELVQRGYRFALSLTHDAAQAEDLIQDAWFAVLRARGSWNPQYLFTTVRNRFIDQYRRDRAVGFESLDHHPEPEGCDDQQAGSASSRLWDDEPGSVTLNGSLDSALGRLRPEERAVLYLSAVEGFTAKQIGEMLDWPRGTVLSMLHRSKNKIRGTGRAGLPDGKAPGAPGLDESPGSESRP